MGDRAMAQIKTEGGSLYFYTHWNGSKLPEVAALALKESSVRAGDDPYELKIVVDVLIREAGGRDEETGGGLMFKPNAEDEYNSDQPSVIIDLIKKEVKVRRPERK